MNLSRLTYEQSKRAKNIGFDWTVNSFVHIDSASEPYAASPVNANQWNNCVSIPENALFLQWCREVKGIYGQVIVAKKPSMRCEFSVHTQNWSGTFLTNEELPYPQAETALINYLLDLLEKKTK